MAVLDGEVSGLEAANGRIPAAAAEPAAAAPNQDFTLYDFQKSRTLGIGSERSLGRPKEWDGKETGFDIFMFRLANWLSSMPGNCEDLLEEASRRTTPITSANFTPSTVVMSKGVMQALKAW